MILRRDIPDIPLSSITPPVETSPEVAKSLDWFCAELNSAEKDFYAFMGVDTFFLTLKSRAEDHGIEAAQIAAATYEAKCGEFPEESLEHERFRFRSDVSKAVVETSKNIDRIIEEKGSLW